MQEIVPIYSILDKYDIVAGDLSLDDTTGIEQTSKIHAYRIHPGYDPKEITNDVCLLYLSKSYTFNDNVTAIKLAKKDPIVGTECDISGWGTLHVSKVYY